MIAEIIITATYRETSLMDTPVSISAVDADTIDQFGAADRSVLNPPDQRHHRRLYRRHAHDFTHPPALATRRRAVRPGACGSTEGASSGHTVRGRRPGPCHPLHLQRTGPLRFDHRVQAGAFLQGESDDTGYRVDAIVNIPLSENFAVRRTAFSDDAAGYRSGASTRWQSRRCLVGAPGRPFPACVLLLPKP